MKITSCTEFFIEWSFYSIAHTRALALRDSGKADKALADFEKFNNDRAEPDYAIMGNIARCLMKLERYKEAQEWIIKSLIMLKSKSSYRHRTNIGYAYLWIAELMYQQKRYIDAKAFLM